MRAILAAGLALAFTSGAALAQGAPIWNGAYIGAQVGYSFASTELSGGATLNNGAGTASLDGISSEGVTGTVTAGYDFMLGDGILAGVFGDYRFGSVETTLHAEGVNMGTIDGKGKYDETWAIGARLGLIKHTTLWYVSAGYTETTVKASVIAVDTNNNTWSGSGSKGLSGYFVGAGVEQPLFGSVFARLDYRYSDFGKTRVWQDGTDFADLNVHDHTVRVGAVYKFGIDRREVAPAPLK